MPDVEAWLQFIFSFRVLKTGSTNGKNRKEGLSQRLGREVRL
jgi:hypothetical protein